MVTVFTCPCFGHTRSHSTRTRAHVYPHDLHRVFQLVLCNGRIYPHHFETVIYIYIYNKARTLTLLLIVILLVSRLIAHHRTFFPRRDRKGVQVTRRGRVARIQRCIKDNNTLYRNEISTLRRLMPADIHDTVPCTKRPPLSQHNVSSEILYGAERSLTILIFSSFGRTLHLKFDRFDRSRVLSRALLSRKYPIFEREGGGGKKKKGKKSQ